MTHDNPLDDSNEDHEPMDDALPTPPDHEDNDERR